MKKNYNNNHIHLNIIFVYSPVLFTVLLYMTVLTFDCYCCLSSGGAGEEAFTAPTGQQRAGQQNT